ncbi:MAG: hypothetical protein QM754_13465 [Tepidisphaeraceae bacterium]
MKSEERHALQKNDLDSSLSDLPGLWAKHGNKILLAITGVALVYFAVNYRHNQAVKRQAETQQALANAWAAVRQLDQYAQAAPTEFEKIRGGLENDINQSVETVVSDSDASTLQAAWAWLARGELYWTVANAGKASPATAPASQPTSKPADNPLGLAANAYNKVITDYAAAVEPVKLARLGLASVAEDQGDFTTARNQYKALIETAGLPEGDLAIAKARLAKLDDIEKPTLLLPATQPVTAKADTDLMIPKPEGLTSVGPTIPAATQPAATQPAASQPVQ